MKILHVIPGLTIERGGPTAVIQALTRCQAAAGHTVAVLTTDQGARNGEQAATVAGIVELERVRVRGPDRIAYAPGFRIALRGRLRAIDVLHVHSLFTYPVHVALQEAAAAGVPVVMRPCGLLHPYSLGRSRWVKRAYLALWGKLVHRACTTWHYTSEQEELASWPPPPKPAFVLPNGVEPDDFNLPREAALAHVHRTWPQLGGAPYVLFLSRLHAKKRLDLLVEAFLTGAPRQYRLVVAGPDEENIWEPLRRRWLDSEVAQRVLRVGAVRGEDKVALLAGADLFALPSEHENFGVAALEALASGVPVMLSPHVDLAAAAATAGFGTVVPLDVTSWRERLAQLGAPPRGDAVRQWVREHYSWDEIATRLVERYAACGSAIAKPYAATLR
jgi:glycosyltransferase involved in cell wall biosynthesis